MDTVLNKGEQTENVSHRSNSAYSFNDGLSVSRTPLSPLGTPTRIVVTPSGIVHTPIRSLAFTPTFQIDKTDDYDIDNESALEVTTLDYPSINSSIQSLQSLKSPNLSSRPVSQQTLQSLKSPNLSTRPTSKQTLHLSVQSLQTIGQIAIIVLVKKMATRWPFCLV